MVSDSNVVVTVGMLSPAMVAICMTQGSGVGLDVCFSLSEGKKGEAAARSRINCFMILLAGNDFPQLLLDRWLSRVRFRFKLLVFLLPEHFLSIRF